MKIGDLVRYRGWGKASSEGPMGIVVEETATDSEYHWRIRVAWLGEEIPIQASVLSTKKSRITSWVSPKHFEVISEISQR